MEQPIRTRPAWPRPASNVLQSSHSVSSFLKLRCWIQHLPLLNSSILRKKVSLLTHHRRVFLHLPFRFAMLRSYISKGNGHMLGTRATRKLGRSFLG